VILTSDADAFPTKDDIFNTIINGLRVKKEVFIFQYYYTEDMGSTYPLSFIAMTKRKWNRFFVISPTTMVSVVEEVTAAAKVYRKDVPLWFLDQIFVSRGIIKSRLCLAQVDHNKFWKRLYMKKETYFEETRDKIKTDPITGISYNSKGEIDVCFYGNSEFRNCNLKTKWKFRNNCTWWHFRPEENGTDFKTKYDEVLENNVLTHPV